MTVTLLSRAVTSQDAYHNDVYTTTETVLTGCIVYPRNSSELVQGQDTVIVGLTLLVPPGTTIKAIDQVRIGSDVYDVDGQPGDWTSGLTGWAPGIQVALTKVSG